MGKGYEFENLIKGGAIPKEYIKPIEAGIVGAETGVMAGFPMVDMESCADRWIFSRSGFQ